jgi:hypothetical protein
LPPESSPIGSWRRWLFCHRSSIFVSIPNNEKLWLRVVRHFHQHLTWLRQLCYRVARTQPLHLHQQCCFYFWSCANRTSILRKDNF